MKLILRADVDNLGRLGDVVTVKPGYGRNYLIPEGLAMLASDANIKVFELERKKLQAQVDALRSQADVVAGNIAAAEVVIRVRVGEGDKLYGSVTTANIAEILAESGVELDKRKILMPDPIRSLGRYALDVKLHPDVTGSLSVLVVRHDWEPGQPVTAAEAEALAAEKAEQEAAAKAAEAAEAAPEAAEAAEEQTGDDEPEQTESE